MPKDIVCLLQPSDASARALQIAADLARRHNAHLTGVYIVPPDPTPILAAGGELGGPAIPPQAFDQIPNVYRERQGEVKSWFEAACAAGDTWLAVEGVPVPLAVEHARLADLVVVSRAADESNSAFPAGLESSLMLESGRPVLSVPGNFEHAQTGRKVLIGWTHTREATRAVHDALPLLRDADVVEALTLTQAAPDDAHTPVTFDLTAHLARHGVQLEWHQQTSDAAPAAALQAHAAAGGFDLIVSGAYGHSRLRELVFGGTTRELLSDAPVPVLLSN